MLASGRANNVCRRFSLRRDHEIGVHGGNSLALGARAAKSQDNPLRCLRHLVNVMRWSLCCVLCSINTPSWPHRGETPGPVKPNFAPPHNACPTTLPVLCSWVRERSFVCFEPWMSLQLSQLVHDVPFFKCFVLRPATSVTSHRAPGPRSVRNRIYRGRFLLLLEKVLFLQGENFPLFFIAQLPYGGMVVGAAQSFSQPA